ncbi:hypothetical protein BH11MYX1_BH11MYX1_37860 [soil metagenome]
MTTTAAALVLALAACTGSISGDDDGTTATGTPEQAIAKQKWHEQAYPVFSTVCISCHAGSMIAAPAFVKSTDEASMRTGLLAWDPAVINLEAPESSRVIRKGAHQGTPELDVTQTANILGWVQAERSAANLPGTTDVTITTAKITPLICTGGVAGVDSTCPVNHVDLGDVGLTGATLDFVAQQLSDSIYLSDIYVKASTQGAYLEHPLFVSWPQAGNPIPDTLDRFFAVKLNLAAATSTPTCPGASCDHVGAGAAAFIGFPSTNRLSITFKVADPYHPDTTSPPPSSGCGTNGFASFLAKVKPVLAPVCAGCHGGANAGAKNAMDLSGLASTTDNNTCLQVRAHVNFQTQASSGILLAPTPGQDVAHPAGGKLSAATNPTLNAFSTAVNAWITVETAGN